MRSIATRTGDKGETSLYSGKRVPKTDPAIDLVGELDELNSQLGLAACHCTKSIYSIRHIQRQLFRVAHEVATPPDKRSKCDVINKEDVEHLDSKVALLEAKIEMPRGFVIPGATSGSGFIDHGRAICRRCERKLLALHPHWINNEDLIQWMNRLSDYLWLAARYEEGPNTVLK